MTNERTALLMVKPMWPNSARVEFVDALLAVRIARRVHFLEHERMAADRALAEDDERAREDVRAFDRDGDRDDLVAAAEIVARA